MIELSAFTAAFYLTFAAPEPLFHIQAPLAVCLSFFSQLLQHTPHLDSDICIFLFLSKQTLLPLSFTGNRSLTLGFHMVCPAFITLSVTPAFCLFTRAVFVFHPYLL